MTVNGERYAMAITDDLQPIATMAVGDLKVRSVRWAGDDNMVITMSSTEDLGIGFTTDRAELWRAFVMPVGKQTNEPRAVFADQRNIANFTRGYFGTRQVDGRWKMFYGGLSLMRGNGVNRQGFYFDHGRPDLFAVDPLDMSNDKIETSAPEGAWRDWLLGADGNVVARLDMEERSGNWELRNADRQKLASGKDLLGNVSLVALGYDGDTVIYSYEYDGTQHWMEVPLDASSEPRPIFEDVGIGRLYTDPATGQLIGYMSGGDDPRPFFHDQNQQQIAEKVMKAFGGKNPRLIDWTSDMMHVLVRIDGGDDSGSWFVVDIATMSAKAIGYERPLIPPDHVGRQSVFEYTARDGLGMDGILTLPPGSDGKNLPLVVMPHGGPHSHDTTGFDWWAQAYASRGYAVFQPNFRGSTNRDLAFERASDGEWGGKMQTDITDGVDVLAMQGIVDPKRTCIVGGSYGGYAALAGVTIEQGRYRCAVAVAPVTDLYLMVDNDMKRTNSNRMLKRSLALELGPRSEFGARSPRRLADRADAPILLIHGRDDLVVEIEQSEKMADALKDAGKPYEFVVLDGEDHHLSRAATRRRMLQLSVEFVERHNPPD